MKITVNDRVFSTENFRQTDWMVRQGIRSEREDIGEIRVVYLEPRPDLDNVPFIQEKLSLITGIAERIGFFMEQKKAEIQLRRSEAELAKLNASLEQTVKERTRTLEEEVALRMKAEEGIVASLKEKEMLLKEIHHRVKNNMQVISSLLLLQSQAIGDENIKALFAESMTRIRTIALVHEQLYRSDNLSEIEYGDYLRKMFGPVFESYKADIRRIAMVIESDKAMVTIEKAVPCSLIVNEMISNSLKHAFPGDRKGEIRIRFSLDAAKENYILDYSDNGIGLPQGFVVGKSGSLGMSLINGLTKQLKGSLAMVPGPGVHYAITFPARELRGKS